MLEYSALASLIIAGFILLLSPGGAKGLTTEIGRISATAKEAAVFFVTGITPAQIQNTYQASTTNPDKKVRILIVPGHQPAEGGTQFGTVYERDVVVDIANALADLLARNAHYDVTVARGKMAWNPVLQSYFDAHAPDIEAFKESQKLQMQNHIADGSILPEADQIYHNTTSATGALQLYGINKWANEHSFDVTLHLHLNDYAGRRARAVGTYDGFTIYVPNHQYSNAQASIAIGTAIAKRLNAYHATSTLPKEDKGVVEDQELIAIGSNNSANAAALLIEYGYIYEEQFQNSSIRPLAIADYAYQTYLGLQDFFNDPIRSTYGSVTFPYEWSTVTAKQTERGPGVYALQAALHYLGVYPPEGKRFSDCPITGKVGPCTRAAIAAYQVTRGLEATGEMGPQTRAALEQDLATP